MTPSFKFPGPMLGMEWEEWPRGHDYQLAEAKLDGFRLQVQLEGGACVGVYCRDTKPVGWAPNVQHIVDELLELGFDNCIVDGEVAAADWNRTGIVKRGFSAKNGYTRPDDAVMAEIRKEIKFYVFDLVHLAGIQYVTTRAKEPVAVYSVALKDRRTELDKYCRGAALVDVVRLVEQRAVRSELEIDELVAAWAGPGCDGVMVKQPLGIYSFDKGKSWRKRKRHKTFEVCVVDAQEGQGKDAGSLGAFVCVDAAGGSLKVGTGLTTAQRKEFWARRDELRGTIIEVKSQDDDVAKTARHPRVRSRTTRPHLFIGKALDSNGLSATVLSDRGGGSMGKKLGPMARTIKLARKYLAAGWAKGNLFQSFDVESGAIVKGGCHCVSGALSRAEQELMPANPRYPTQYSDYEYASRSLHEFVYKNGVSPQARTAFRARTDANVDIHDGCGAAIVRWNDEDRRRKSEVVAALDRALEKAKELGI